MGSAKDATLAESGSKGMEFLYNPKSIAVIGASMDPGKPGGKPLVALRARGFKGTVVAVNPQHKEMYGFPCYPSLLDVPDEIELIVISVPAVLVMDVLQQAVTKGVKAAVIFTSGFGEVDQAGMVVQKEMTAFARKHGIRLLGPNCLGLMNLTNSNMASFAHIMDLEPIRPGTLAFVTQSGALGAMIYQEATDGGVGFSSFASVGNEADTEVADHIEYLLTDPNAQVIGGYLEGARDGDKLRRVAERALLEGKPILLLKVGRTRAGARAANSHTGSLAGDDQIYDAFFRQMGIIRINELSELVAFVHLHGSGGNFEKTRVAILGGSGGHGVMMTDICESIGLQVPEILGETRSKLEAILPPFGSSKNPIDVTAAAGQDPTLMTRALRVLSTTNEVDIVMMQGFVRDVESARDIVDVVKNTKNPIVITVRNNNQPDLVEPMALLRQSGVTMLAEGRQSAKAIVDLGWYQRKVRAAREQEGKEPVGQAPDRAVTDRLLTAGKALAEYECKQVLAAYGVSVTREELARSAEEAVTLATKIGYPIAMKVQSAEILHKTEAKAIRLNLQSADEVRAAFAEIMVNARAYAPTAVIQGVLVQEMLKGGVEVIIGMTTDPIFGPVLMFGLGGIFVEVLKDVSFRVAPLKRRDAEDMLDEIKGRKVLEGVRGQPPVNREMLIDILLKVSRLVSDYRGQIGELDINPLLVYPDRAVAVDALITLK